jgi:lipoate-protein ligase A
MPSLPEAFISYLTEALEVILETSFQPSQLNKEELELAQKLDLERYSLKTWNEMR